MVLRRAQLPRHRHKDRARVLLRAVLYPVAQVVPAIDRLEAGPDLGVRVVAVRVPQLAGLVQVAVAVAEVGSLGVALCEGGLAGGIERARGGGQRTRCWPRHSSPIETESIKSKNPSCVRTYASDSALITTFNGLHSEDEMLAAQPGLSTAPCTDSLSEPASVGRDLQRRRSQRTARRIAQPLTHSEPRSIRC